MQPEASLPCSQDPANWLRAELLQSCPDPKLYILNNNCNIIL
jgi:hypothetical protein